MFARNKALKTSIKSSLNKAISTTVRRGGLLAAVVAATCAFCASAALAQPVEYYFTVNTSSIAGQQGFISYEFLPGGADSVTLSDVFNVDYLAGYTEDNNQADIAANSFGDYTYSGGDPANGTMDNNVAGGGTFVTVPVTFGQQFDVLNTLTGPGIDPFDGSTLSINILDPNGNPLLSPNGDVIDENISGQGKVTITNNNPVVATTELVPESSSSVLLMAALAAFGLLGLWRSRSRCAGYVKGLSAKAMSKGGMLVLIGALLLVAAAQMPAHAQAGSGGTLANNPVGLTPAAGLPIYTNAPSVGSGEPQQGAPAVPVPTTTPVVVPLFSDYTFMDFNLHPFSYPGPPAGGPWAKIVLVVDFYCTPATQFDRTQFIWIGDTMVEFGTTPEPSATRTPDWEVQKDVTEYSALLSQPHDSTTSGIELDNAFTSPYLGIYHGTGYLLFYPADQSNPTPTTPSVILPMQTQPYPDFLFPPGTQGSLSTMSTTLTFPTNMDKAYLEVWTQNQNNDEFFWDMGLATATPYGGFREAEVSVDGTQVGSTSCFPYVFSGGDNPNFWIPEGDIEQYEFKPRYVDFTPFVGILNDGNPHTVSINMYDETVQYWTVAGNFLIYTDPYLSKVYGGLTVDSAATPSPTINGPGSTVAGLTTVGNIENNVLDGYALTSQGWQETTVATNENYTDGLTYAAGRRGISLSSLAIADNRNVTTTSNATFGSSTLVQNHDAGFHFSFSPITSSLFDTINDTLNGQPYYSANLTYSMLGAATTSGGQTYAFSDSLGNSWNENTTSGNTRTITSVTYGQNNNLSNPFWPLGSIIPNDWLQTTNS